MRRTAVHLFAVMLITGMSLPALFALLQTGYYTNHDGEGHIIRLEEFHQAILDGHFPVRWAKRLMYGYGYPFFNFNYPLAYYSGELFRLTGFSSVDAIKSVFAFSFIASGIVMYFWQKSLWGSVGGLTAAFLYLYAPYRFSNIYVRGSLAEHVAFLFLPLVFWMTTWIAHSSHRTIPIIVGGFAYAGLMLSHNISAFITSILLGSYFFFLAWHERRPRILLSLSAMVLIGLTFSSYFWVPALYEKQFTLLDQTIGRDYPNHFVALWQLVIPSWGFGSSVAGTNDGMSFQFGSVHIAIYVFAICAIVWLVKRDVRHKRLALFFVLATLAGIFFMLSISKPLWDTLPLLPFTQFPWRFLLWTTLTIAVCGGFVGSHIHRLRVPDRIHRALVPTTTIAVLFILLLATNWTYMKVNQPVSISAPSGEWIAGSTTWADEQSPQWFTPRPTSAPAFRVSVDNRKAPVQITQWKTHLHTYTIRTEIPTTAVEHTAYYPGWEVMVNGVQTPIDYTSKESGGKLRFPIPQGTITVTSQLTETPLRSAANTISLFTLLSCILILFTRAHVNRWKRTLTRWKL